MKPVDVNSSTYIDVSIKNRGKNPKFVVCVHERISKCSNICAKSYVPN